MKNKINIAELLRDCPKGMELDCTMFDDVTFERFDVEQNRCYFKAGPADTFWTTCYGTINGSPFGKCVIFPKGKTTWEGFQRPFKDGDVLTYTGQYTTTFIYRNKDNEPHFATSFYVAYSSEAPSHNFLIYNKYTLIALNENCDVRIATEEEKQKLFNAIKENSYKWNEETKTLEKLFEPKFKVGDIVQDKDNYKVRIFDVSIEDKCYEYESLAVNGIGGISFDRQDDWELVPNKFDITTLKPFDKVLVRLTKDGVWNATFFSHYDKEVKWGCYPFVTTSSKSYSMCIPYNYDTKHLLGTTDACGDYYKTWE